MEHNDLIKLRDKYHDYRRLMDVRAVQTENSDDMIVMGTPVIFDKPYLLFEFFGKKVYEIISRESFANTDYRDVPLKYNHGDGKGTPARTTSKTEKGRLTISVLPDRVEMRANLLPTSGGKDLFMEVQAGTVAQMSWAFIEDREKEEILETEDSITFTVKEVLRVFDVSAVDFGANEETSIYARRRGDLDERFRQLDEQKRAFYAQRIKILNQI